MYAAPIFMIAAAGKVEMLFHDFEDLENHPNAGPLMATFEQLFEGMFERSPEEILGDQFDTEGVDVQPGSEQDLLMKGVHMHSLILDFVKDMCSDSHISVNVSVPAMLIDMQVDITSPGIKQAADLALHLMIQTIQQDINFMKQ